MNDDAIRLAAYNDALMPALRPHEAEALAAKREEALALKAELPSHMTLQRDEHGRWVCS